MKTAIYTPYLDTIGGGEKYMMTIAEVLALYGEVDILLDYHLAELDTQDIKNKLESMHGLNLSRVKFIKAPFRGRENILQRAAFLKKYDWFFYLTDGSIFIPAAKNNIIHFQVPFTNTEAVGIKGRIKLNFWKEAIYNSNFTKGIVEKSWPIKGRVIYPPVDVDLIRPDRKKKQIVSVGRFHLATKSKKHELIIQTFKKLFKNKKIEGWSLHLVGGMEDGSKPYLEELQKEASDAPIYFYPNMPVKDLRELYGNSSIYWHFKGFKEEDPKKFEHFGISTVEAMAGGCIPVVINKGGQREIVVNKESGFLWDTLEELENFTLELINDQKLINRMMDKAVLRSKNFSKLKFQEEILNLVGCL